MYRYSSKIAWQTLNDQVVVLDLDSRTAMGLNPSGAFSWALIETHTIAEIATALSAEFDVELSTAKSEVESFVEDMCDRGLLEKTA